MTIPGTLKFAYHWKFDEKKDYLTKIEYKHFTQLMEIGDVTIFKVKECANGECERLVPKQGAFAYCSLGCKEKKEGENNETG